MASKFSKRVVSWLKGHGFVLLLVIICSFVAGKNYQPETWLSGWDTLHPEFNFPLYFKRVFFGVWQEHQGLGAVASQAHPAEIIRLLFYYPLSLFLPASFLRYFYFFLTLVLGPLGIYYFLKRVIVPENHSPLLCQAISFGGALFYLLNLGTLQYYYLPLEMFATQYAFLGWLFLFASEFLKRGERKQLFYFAIATLSAAPSAHTATLFFAYFLGLSLFIVTSISLSFSKKNIKRGLIIILLALLLNSFWLFPNLYFIKNHGAEVANSKIHTQFSNQAFLTGQEFGTLKDTVLLKNFLFDWGEYDEKQGQFVFVFDEWLPHLQKPIISVMGYVFFLIIILGILRAIKGKNRNAIAILPLFLMAFCFVANGTSPFKEIFSFFQEKVPLFGEALRFPFTKFSLLLIFSYAVYFAMGLELIWQFFKKYFPRYQNGVILALTFLVILSLVYYMLPSFGGRLISPSMKVSFPPEYFQSFSWLNQQEESGRIAFFPVHTFRGWQYYRWGYEGAGFEWFGLKQPVLMREFDRWSPYNENYYWEISYAFYSGDLNLLENVLAKYQVKWLWVDENVFDPSSSKDVYFDKLAQLLSSSKKISFMKEFGRIKIYEVKPDCPFQNFIDLSLAPINIEPKYDWSNYDLAYLENGDYFTDSQSLPQVYYPFRSLFTGRSQEDLEFSVEEKDDYFLFKAPIDKELTNYYLDIPPFYQEELFSISAQDMGNIRYQSPEVYYNGSVLEVIIPKEKGYFSAEIDPVKEYEELKAKNCDQFHPEGLVKSEIVKEGERKLLRLSARNAYNCGTSFLLSNLPHQYAYLITFEARNIKGQSLLFWLENLNVRKADIESYLPPKKELTTYYFIQPPMEKDGLQYSLHFDNLSIGQKEAVNDLGRVTVNLIPFNFLTSLKLFSPQEELRKNAQKTFELADFEVSHPNPSFYRVKINNKEDDLKEPLLLTLSQSFENGWRSSLGKHVLVNNWANGWLIDNLDEAEGKEIIIFFWPQILEYLGFLFIPLGLFLITRVKK